MSVRAKGYRWEKLRAKVLAEEDICWLCGHDVDKTLRTPHPLSPEAHHIVPLSKGGDEYDRNNVHLTHRRCNRDQADRLPARTFETLRVW